MFDSIRPTRLIGLAMVDQPVPGVCLHTGRNYDAPPPIPSLRRPDGEFQHEASIPFHQRRHVSCHVWVLGCPHVQFTPVSVY